MWQTLWIGLIATLSIVGSLAFACAAPFAAIAALAAHRIERPQGLVLVALAWLSNQIIGFAVLGYPMTFGSFAWGIAIGLAALLAFVSAVVATAWTERIAIGLATAFASSFIVYELVLYIAGTLLVSSDDAFAIATIVRVLEINLVSLVGILVVHRLVIAVKSPAKREASTG